MVTCLIKLQAEMISSNWHLTLESERQEGMVENVDTWKIHVG